ncbi:peptidase zinc-dependent [Haloterrigena alkaliphila]|uniref:Peptidase zinc-dependent n=1 Tax=Haloterrigena alkaliphila TaxID=2816475 RepID=A0A8A2VHB3_9EURY|nr:peptidase zinc-dependent [Haloterrigena alkaliphila]QSX00091.1 peptidase zinc-dependent [Haloterrigena alkaliphila]
MAVFPHGSAPRVAVVPIGDPPTTACETVAATLSETFDLSVPIRQGIDAPADKSAADSPRGNAEPFLESLGDETDGIDLAVGVTETPLRTHPSDRALFGLGLEFGPVGVVSTAGLFSGDESDDNGSDEYGSDGDEPSALERERLATETLAVAGAMLGLRTSLHGTDVRAEQPCAGSANDALDQLDAAPASYCEDCRRALTGESPVLEPPGPDGWIVRPRHEAVFAFADRWARGEPKWRDYPLMGTGLLVVNAERLGSRLRAHLGRLPRPGSVSTRDLPRPVRATYRIAHCWSTVACYLFWIFVWLRAFVDVHAGLFGTAFSAGGLVALVAVGVVLGIVTGRFVAAIAGGFYGGLRGPAAGNR